MASQPRSRKTSVPGRLRTLTKSLSKTVGSFTRHRSLPKMDDKNPCSRVVIPKSPEMDQFSNYDPLEYPRKYRNTYTPGTLTGPLEFVDNWAMQRTGGNVLVVIGKAFMGKTVLATELCRRGSESIQQIDGSNTNEMLHSKFPLVAAHFFTPQNPTEMNAYKWFLRSIAYQLASSIPGYGEALNVTEFYSKPDTDMMARTDREWFEMLIANPIRSERITVPESRLVVIVDGLQHSSNHESISSILQIVWNYWHQSVPQWLGLVVTCLPSMLPGRHPQLSNIMDTSSKVLQFEIDQNASSHVEDMRQLCRKGLRISRSFSWHKNRIELDTPTNLLFATEKMTEQTLGHSLYFQSVRLESGKPIGKHFDVADCSVLFHARFAQVLGSLGEDQETFRAAFGPLACSRQPMVKDVWLRAFQACHSKGTVPTSHQLGIILEVLVIPENLDGLVYFCHPSMACWLSTARFHDKPRGLHVSPRDFHGKLANDVFLDMCNQLASEKNLPEITLGEMAGRRLQPDVPSDPRNGQPRTSSATRMYVLSHWWYHLHRAKMTITLIGDLYNLITLLELGMQPMEMARQIRKAMLAASNGNNAKGAVNDARLKQPVKNKFLLVALIIERAESALASSSWQLPAHLLANLFYRLPFRPTPSPIVLLVQQCMMFQPPPPFSRWYKPIVSSMHLHTRDLLVLQSEVLVQTFKLEERIELLAVSPDGFFVATPLLEGGIGILNVNSGVMSTLEVEVEQRHRGRVTVIQFSKRNSILATGGSDGVIKLWDIHAMAPMLPGGCALKVPGGAPVECIDFLSANSTMVAGYGDGYVRAWNYMTGELSTAIPTGDFPVKYVRVAVTEYDSATVVSATKHGNVLVHAADTGELLNEIKLTPFLADKRFETYGVQMQPDKGYVFRNGSIGSFNYSGSSVAKYVAMKPSAPLLCSENLNTVHCDRESSGSAIEIRFADTSEVVMLQAHSAQITCSAISGDLLVTGSHDKSIRVWNLKLLGSSAPNYASSWNNPQKIPNAHLEPINSLSVARDGTIVASASSDGRVGLWDPRKGKMLNELEHTCQVVDVSFFDTHAEGGTESRILSGTSDGSLHVWNLETSKLVAIEQFNASPACITALPNHKGVFCSFWDGTLLVYYGSTFTAVSHEEPLVNISFHQPSHNNELDYQLSSETALGVGQEWRLSLVLNECSDIVDMNFRPLSLSPHSMSRAKRTCGIENTDQQIGFTTTCNSDGLYVEPISFTCADPLTDGGVTTIVAVPYESQLVFVEQVGE